MKENKILNILNELKFSGAEVMLRYSANFFKDRGYDLFCLSTGKRIGEYSEILAQNGYKISHLCFCKSPIYFYRFYKFIKQQKFAVVHIHPERGFFLHAFLARIAGCKKVVRTIHSVFQFKGLLKSRKKIERKLAEKILKVHFIAVSESVYINEKERFSITCRLIDNWVDMDLFRPARNLEEKKNLRNANGINQDFFIIISVGSCTLVKNHSHILQALEQSIKKCPNLYYLHVGNGELLKKEKQLAATLGIESRVCFCGTTDKLYPFLIMSDIFIMPSEYEGIGIAAMEAMSCALPVIAYDVPGLRDLIDDQIDGYLIEKNYNELAHCLIQAYNNKDRLIILGKKAREKTTKRYNKDINLIKLLQIYTSNGT